MYKATIKDVFLSTILEKRIVDSNGRHPVKIRISHKGKKAYFILAKRLSLTSDEWDKLPQARSNQAAKLKNTIQEEFTFYQSLVKSLTDKEEYSHDNLRKYKEKQPIKYVFDKFKVIINDLKENGQVNTAISYTSTLKSLQQYSKKNLVFEDITKKWLEDYERIITNEELAKGRLKINKDDKRKKFKISDTTLGIYLRNLRTVYNRAIKDGDVNESLYPFNRNEKDDKYKIPIGEGTKIALTIEQIQAIENYKPNNKECDRIKDIFLLSFHLAGLNLKDLLLLKWDNYKDGELSVVREKTKRTNRIKGKKIFIYVNDKAKAIIEKISIESKGDYILPYMISNPTPEDVVRITKNLTKLANKYLTKIGETLGINNLTTMVSRHSFATILKNAGTSEAFISEALGHGSIITTQNYFKGFEKKQRQENFELLSKITSNN